MINKINDLSLQSKLVAALVGMVLFSTVLGTVVLTFFLARSMRNSTLESLQGRLKLVEAKEADTLRGLEIYTDLIASDMTFGQVLSFDSAMGIDAKIVEFQDLSKADLVAFVPNPDVYVSIKDNVFSNLSDDDLGQKLKTHESIKSMIETPLETARTGWMGLGGDLYLFAAKNVLHFGQNMGFIYLGFKLSEPLLNGWVNESDFEVGLWNGDQVLASTAGLEGLALEGIKNSKTFGDIREVAAAGTRFYSLSMGLKESQSGRSLGKMGAFVSTESIERTQRSTFVRAIFVAGIGALVSGFLGLLMAKAVARPIDKMTKQIKTMSEESSFDSEVDEPEGKETKLLAHAFNGLMGQLRQAHEKIAANEERMRQELTMASSVQGMLFPKREMEFNDVKIASFIEASTEIGGDWFGYAVDERRENLSVLIGDVTGHGAPAALVTAITNGFFQGIRSTQDLMRTLSTRSKSSWEMSTAEMLERLNEILLETTQGELYMTFFASILNLKTLELRYANAGHNRPFLGHHNEKGKYKVSVLPSDPSQRLGENRDVQFQEQRIQLTRGDMVFWYTDGLLECESPDKEQFGKRRIVSLLKKMPNESSGEILEKVKETSYAFYGDEPRVDDITAVIARV